MSDKIVDRIAKYLALAENEGATEAERETAMAQAMKWSQFHSIDLSVARAHSAKKQKAEVPEKRTFQTGKVGQTQAKNSHFTDLMLAICNVYDIECTISGSAAYVFGWGMPSDLDLAEKLFALLAVQMVQEAEAELKKGANTELRLEPKKVRVEIPEDERAWGQWDGTPGGEEAESCRYDEQDEQLRDDPKREGGKLRYRWVSQGPSWQGNGYYDWVKSYPPPRFKLEVVTDDEGNAVMEDKRVSVSDARIWRTNFYIGFVNRARSRLREAKREALKEAGIDMKDDSDSRAVALRDKAKEVRDAFEENERWVLDHGGSYGGASASRYDHMGQLAGDEAGKRAVLGNEKDLRGGS